MARNSMSTTSSAKRRRSGIPPDHRRGRRANLDSLSACNRGTAQAVGHLQSRPPLTSDRSPPAATRMSINSRAPSTISSMLTTAASCPTSGEAVARRQPTAPSTTSVTPVPIPRQLQLIRSGASSSCGTRGATATRPRRSGCAWRDGRDAYLRQSRGRRGRSPTNGPT
jgi:hypothetical protein